MLQGMSTTQVMLLMIYKVMLQIISNDVLYNMIEM
jgi:hypothetical protein